MLLTGREKIEFTYIGKKELDINKWYMDHKKFDVDKAIEDGVLIKVELTVWAGNGLYICEYWNGPDESGYMVRTLNEGLPRDEIDLPNGWKIASKRNEVLASYGDEYLLPKEEEVSADTTA